MSNMYSIEAEASVIGACLLGGKKTLKEIDLRPEHFYSKFWRECYSQLLKMNISDNEIDLVQLQLRLKSIGFDNPSESITQALELAPVQSMAIPNAKTVLKYYKARQAQEATQTLSALASSSLNILDIESEISNVISKLNQVLNGETNNGILKFAELLLQAYDKAVNPTLERKFMLRLTDCDRILQGIRDSDYTIIAARPAVGKSAFISQVMLDMAKSGAKPLIYSLEMSGIEIAQRALAREAVISLATIRDNKPIGESIMNAEEQLWESAKSLERLNIDLSTTTDLTPSRVYRDIAGTNRDIVFIDHIGLMRPDIKAENRNQEIAQISRDLRLIAMKTNIPIVVACQLNRASERTTDKRPTLIDLRDSGSLEQDATTVIALSTHGDRQDNKVLLDILKNRNGETGSVMLHFDKPHMRFQEIERRELL